MQNILIGSALTITTAVIHAGFMLLLMDALRVTQPKAWNLHRRSVRATLIACTVLLMAMASILESALWAAVYIAVGAIEGGFETALYFSTVTYTTLGYGDITIAGDYRMLAALQAANGIIMFGWTTAIIVRVVQKIYVRQPSTVD